MPDRAASAAPGWPAAPSAAEPGFAARLQQHLQAVWRYLRRHGASAHEADDLTQEAGLIAWQKGALGLDPAATAAFLQRTARFLWLRRCGHRRDAQLLAEAVDELWAAETAAGEDGLLPALRDCLGRLPPRSRRAVELAYGLGDAEPHHRPDLAAALGLQPNGAKTLLQRIRQQLRECLDRSQP